MWNPCHPVPKTEDGQCFFCHNACLHLEMRLLAKHSLFGSAPSGLSKGQPESSPGRCTARPWQTSGPGPTFGPRHAETWATATCGTTSQMLWAMHRIRSRTHFGGGLLTQVCRPNGVSRRAGLECAKVRTVTRSGRLIAQYSLQVWLDDYDIPGSSIDGRPARTWQIRIRLRLVSTDHGQQVAGANSTRWSWRRPTSCPETTAWTLSLSLGPVGPGPRRVNSQYVQLMFLWHKYFPRSIFRRPWNGPFGSILLCRDNLEMRVVHSARNASDYHGNNMFLTCKIPKSGLAAWAKRQPKYSWCLLVSMKRSPEDEGDQLKMKLNHHKTRPCFPHNAKPLSGRRPTGALKCGFLKDQYVGFVQGLGCLSRPLGAHTGRRFGWPRLTAHWFCMLRRLES